MNRAITLVLVIAVILNMTAAIRFIAFPNLDLVYLVLIAVAVAIGAFSVPSLLCRTQA